MRAPYVSDADFTLYQGDALDVLRELPDDSVDCCVTSPPYWGLRDYGTEGQLGLEATPDLFVARMVELFREVRRVLADHGTCWVNLGDSYTAATHHGKGGASTSEKFNDPGDAWRDNVVNERRERGVPDGLKPKDLVGIPWRVAFALQADGWYLRSDIIWAKPNPMPESVTDRPTKAHEYVFLLTKQPRYWFDQEAVREPNNWPVARWGGNGKYEGTPGKATALASAEVNPAGRNIRSVWEIATQPYAEAHFATFPLELPRRCILAGCPEWVCRECGKPRERIVEREGGTWDDRKAAGQPMRYGLASTKGLPANRMVEPETHTVGWSDCACGQRRNEDGILVQPIDKYRPGVVLDPFMGSGTTAFVARQHGRRCIGIELNADYCDLAARRLQQLSLFAEEAS